MMALGLVLGYFVSVNLMALFKAKTSEKSK